MEKAKLKTGHEETDEKKEIAQWAGTRPQTNWKAPTNTADGALENETSPSRPFPFR